VVKPKFVDGSVRAQGHKDIWNLSNRKLSVKDQIEGMLGVLHYCRLSRIRKETGGGLRARDHAMRLTSVSPWE